MKLKIFYDKSGNGKYVIVDDNTGNKDAAAKIVNECFKSRGGGIIETEGNSNECMFVIPNSAADINVLYKEIRQDIINQCAASGLDVQCELHSMAFGAENTSTTQLPQRLSNAASGNLTAAYGSAVRTKQEPEHKIETQDFAAKSKLVQEKIIKTLATELKNYATQFQDRYEATPSNDAPGLPKLIDAKTKQEKFIPLKNANGELSFLLRGGVEEDPRFVAMIKDAFPSEQHFKVTCTSPESAESIIANMGGDPKKLTFDDVKQPRILEFKEQLKAKYPELKFTSDGPSNSNTKKPKP